MKHLYNILTRMRIRALYAQKDYLEAYSEHTDIRVQQNPHTASGRLWEQIGQLQFRFLVKRGLQPHHTMLDIGCGTLRGGRHFIRYLGRANYTGIDISSEAIKYGKRLVQEEGLLEKHPKLLVSENKNLKFMELDGELFDYLLAHSVFTHLKPEHIEECFKHIGEIMKETSVFFFTFKEANLFRQTGVKGFRYPFTFFETLAEQYGFNLSPADDYNHPRNQQMIELTKN